MNNIFSAIPAGLLRFVVARLLRALISLIIFQFILFLLIQALPDTNSAMSFGDALAQLPRRGRATESQLPSQTVVASEPEISPPGQADEPGVYQLLRESGGSEMLSLLEEAAFLEETVAQQTSAQQESGESPTSAPQPDDAASQDSALLDAEVEPGVEPIATGPSADSLDQVDSTTANYQEGLTAVRPPDQSVWQQFLSWLARFFSGELGESTSSGGQAVSEIIGSKLPRTLLLLVPGTAAGFALGLWLGKQIGWRRRGLVDAVATLGGTVFYTSFPPWLAFVVVSIFAVNLRWFPREKLVNPNLLVFADIRLNVLIMRALLTMTAMVVTWLLVVWTTRRLWRLRLQMRVLGAAIILLLAMLPWISAGLGTLALDLLDHLVLPMFVLALLSFGETMLIMRTTMAEVMEDDHVAQAKLMGYEEGRIRDRHVARVAMVPVLARFIVQLPLVVVGSFVLENVFAWDGIAQELVRAANQSDLPVLMGILSVLGVGLLLAHVTLDVLTAYLDPRLRSSSRVGVA